MRVMAIMLGCSLAGCNSVGDIDVSVDIATIRKALLSWYQCTQAVGSQQRDLLDAALTDMLNAIATQAGTILEVATGGTTAVPAGTERVEVSVDADVTLILPASADQGELAILIVDAGGHANAHNITISTTVVGDAIVTTKNGSYLMVPLMAGGWIAR